MASWSRLKWPKVKRPFSGQPARSDVPDGGSSALARIVPPRGLSGSIAAAEGFFSAVSGEGLSLEIGMLRGEPAWYLRAASSRALERSLGQLHAAYPQAQVRRLDAARPELDPAHLGPGEHAASVDLLASDRQLPIASDWREGADPLGGVLAAAGGSTAGGSTAGGAPPGARLLCRLTVGPAGDGEGDEIRRRSEPAPPPARSGGFDQGPSPLPLVALLAMALAGLQGWRWYSAGEWPLLVASGLGCLVGLPLVGSLVVRLLWRLGPKPLPPAAAASKLAAPLRAARLEVLALGGGEISPARLAQLAARTAAAYGAYDSPAGGRLRPDRVSPSGPPGDALSLLLNSAELAGLWHLPDQGVLPDGVVRTSARRLLPAPGHALSGLRVGTLDADDSAGGAAPDEGAPLPGAVPDGTPARLPEPLLHRNQLIVARTRRGKSTLLSHIAAGILERIASGADRTAVVVVDPHQDLAEAVLGVVPAELAERTIYLDFANQERPIGLNLLDVGLFPDRDRTMEHIVTMMNRLWPQNWGPRMEGALRAALASLHEANQGYPRSRQFTLLDVAPVLTDRALRERVMDEVTDPAVHAWWRDNYDRAGRVLQQQTANPVTSKIGRFTVTRASRLVLGQARSTFDPRQVLEHGGVLVVNTAVGALGEGAAQLVGATLLNLLGLLIEEQVTRSADRRRQVITLVDESSTLGAVDYQRMLSELGKYGASFVLVTQSLTRLDAIDPNLAPTIFSNIDGLTTFSVSAQDARRLTPELGGPIEVEDLVSLPDFTCYARWWDGRTRPPAFSLRVDPPIPVAPGQVRLIAERSAERFGRPLLEVSSEVDGAISERVPAAGAGRQRRSVEELREAREQEFAAESEVRPTASQELPEAPAGDTAWTGGPASGRRP